MLEKQQLGKKVIGMVDSHQMQNLLLPIKEQEGSSSQLRSAHWAKMGVKNPIGFFVEKSVKFSGRHMLYSKT